MAVVRELITRLGFGVDQGSMNRAEGSINKLSGMLSGLAAFASLRALAAVGDSMQSLEARIGMLPQTIGDVGVAFDTIAGRASNAKQSIDAYGEFYVKAGNATQDFIHTQEELLNIVDGAAFGLAASGAGAVAQSQAFFQLGQAIGSPIVQMEEMNTLIDVAPDLFRELGKQIPGAEGNLKKFIGTGKVTGKMLAEGLTKAAVIFEDKMRKMPMTIGTATTLIGNDFKKMVARLNRESGVITGIAEFMASGFKKIEAKFNAFISFVGGGTNALKVFGIALAALLGPIALGGLLSVLGAILSPAGLVVASLVLLGLAIDDIYTYMEGGQSLFGDFLKDLKNGDAITTVLTAGLVAATAQFGYVAVAYAAMWAKMRITALLEGARVAGAWLMAMGPTGWAIAAGAGIVLGIGALMNHVNSTIAEEKGKPRVGPGSVSPRTLLPNLAPASPTAPAFHQTNNFTMPPGTPQEHINLLEKGAVNILGRETEKMARDMNAQGN